MEGEDLHLLECSYSFLPNCQGHLIHVALLSAASCIINLRLLYRIAGGESGMRHFMKQFGPALQWLRIYCA